MSARHASDKSDRTAISPPVPNALGQVLEQGVVITGDISLDLSNIRQPTIRTNLLIHSAGRAQGVSFDVEAENRRLWARLRDLEQANRHLAEQLTRLEAKRRAAERRARIAARAEEPPHVSRYDILVAIAAQPHGVTLDQLAEELAVSVDKLSAPIEELLDMGEIVQRDGAYQMPRRERPAEAVPEEAAPPQVSEPVIKLVEEVLADVEAVLTSRLAGKPAAEAEGIEAAPEAEAPPAAEAEGIEAAAEAEEVVVEPEVPPAAEAEEAVVEPEAPPAAEAGEIEAVEIEFEAEEVEIEVEGVVAEPPAEEVEEALAPVEEAPLPAEVEPRRLPPAETREHIMAALRDQQVGLTLPELGIALKRPWQGLIPLVKSLMNEGLVEKHNKWYYPAGPSAALRAGPTPEDDLLAAIAARPGSTLPRLGEALGVAWQGLTRRVRELVDSQLVEKRGRGYYKK